MRFRVLAAALVIAAALMLAVAVHGPSRLSSAPRAGLEVVPMNPHALAALKAQGKTLKDTPPIGVNQGRKFNPKGDLVGPLTTSEKQNVLVLFVDFSDEPPGGPAQRLDLSYFDDMLFGTTYDPSAYAAYPGHPTDRTLVNYFKEASFGKTDVVTVDLPSKSGWLRLDKPYAYYCQGDGVHDNGFGPYPENVQGLAVDAINGRGPAGRRLLPVRRRRRGPEPLRRARRHRRRVERRPGHHLVAQLGHEPRHRRRLHGRRRHVNNYAMMPEVGGDLTGYPGGGQRALPAHGRRLRPRVRPRARAARRVRLRLRVRGHRPLQPDGRRQLEPLAQRPDFAGNSPVAAGRLEQVPLGLRHAQRRESPAPRA